MDIRRNVYIKPLAAAMAVALGMTSAHAETPANAAFAARMQMFKNVVAQVREDRAQHPQKYQLFPQALAHKVTFPKRHGKQPTAPEATIAVTSCVDNASSATTAGTLRYAVVNAANGDAIDLSACNNSTITLTQGALPVVIDDLSISAGTGNHVTIDGNGTDRVFYVTGPGTGTTNVLALSYLTIRNGKAPVITTGTPPMSIAAGGCIASKYDGIALYSSTVTGCQTVVTNGTAEGGGVVTGGGLYMQSSTISNNVVSSTRTGSGTSTKYGAAGGGAIAANLSYIYDSHIDGNSVSAGGGASIAFVGGLFAAGAKIYGSTISNNSANMSAGNVGNKYVAAAGGLMTKYGSTLLGSTVSGNRATCSTTSTSPNAICFGGGGLFAVYSGGGQGPSGASISYSTISGNHADLIAGGIFSGSALTLTQSTVSGNSAQGGSGITLKYSGAGTATIGNSTIAANTATYIGAGIYNVPGTPSGGGTQVAVPMTLTSSIVAKNTTNGVADDINLETPYTLAVAGSNDLVMAVSANITLPAGTLGADPMLAPLANNGGTTRTMGLLAGSPALDAGSNPNAYANDQRGAGFPRVVGPNPDIGAFEGIAVPAAAAVPAPVLSLWAMGLLASLLGFLGWRRRHSG